ncbi:aminoglycoside phosphotransferase family protein [Nocardia sp. NPDC050793]|uniref:aminoglycoside phosphotransferase family protein n=1 Tax=Nocardia sp. NPDC050793 TaxID=3155159 RepID=UPI0033FFBC81
MIVPPIPERLEKAILFLRGEEDGRAWLDALPARIATYVRRWRLVAESIADNGAMSCCVYCTTPGGIPAVLKIPVDQESGYTEAQLLQRWAPADAAPTILDHDDESGVFLMTRILPGSIAWPENDAGDAAHYGELLTRLNQADLPGPPTLKDLANVAHMRMDWARERFADPSYAPAMKAFGATARLAEAETILGMLLETTTDRHVLHADLQAKNILEGPDHWYTIDPLGAIGDINAEAALWIAIQTGTTSIQQRLDQFADHPLLHPTRLHAWTYVLTVAEYRPYIPASAGRMARFVDATEAAQIITGLSLPGT